jgi:hypothetical protein
VAVGSRAENRDGEIFTISNAGKVLNVRYLGSLERSNFREQIGW